MSQRSKPVVPELGQHRLEREHENLRRVLGLKSRIGTSRVPVEISKSRGASASSLFLYARSVAEYVC